MDQLLLGKRDLLLFWGESAHPRVSVRWSHRAGLVKRGGSALSRGLGARTSYLELPQDNGPTLPRKWRMRAGTTLSRRVSLTATKPFSHRGRAVTLKERETVREIKAGPFWVVLACQFLSNFWYSVDMVCLWSEGVPSFVFRLLVVWIVWKVERKACTTFRMRVGHDWRECFPLSSAVRWFFKS